MTRQARMFTVSGIVLCTISLLLHYQSTVSLTPGSVHPYESKTITVHSKKHSHYTKKTFIFNLCYITPFVSVYYLYGNYWLSLGDFPEGLSEAKGAKKSRAKEKMS